MLIDDFNRCNNTRHTTALLLSCKGNPPSEDSPMSTDHTIQTPAAAQSQPTVLVVDDDELITAFLRAALEAEGYQVCTAVDGAALKVAQEVQPALILLDIMMPGMDGVEVSRRLRADPATAHIPIVAISALDQLNTQAAQMQVNDRLGKPVRLPEFYSMVARWIEPDQG
jgi:CheY-like chemotaxis protein